MDKEVELHGQVMMNKQYEQAEIANLQTKKALQKNFYQNLKEMETNKAEYRRQMVKMANLPSFCEHPRYFSVKTNCYKI